MSIRYGYVDTKDGQLHYRSCAGTRAEPIVFFHMTASASASFEKLMGTLESEHPLIAFDTPNYGQSFRTDAEPTMAYVADVFLEALTALGFERFHAVGHHTGASIAVELAARAPDRVVSITLNGLVAGTAEQNAQLLRTRIVDNPVTDRGAQLLWAWTRILQTETIEVPAEIRNRETIDTLIAGPQWHWAYRAVFTHDLAASAAKVRCPAFLVCARHDRAINYIERARALFPDARELIDEENGVFFIQIQTEAFAPHLLDFIASADAHG